MEFKRSAVQLTIKEERTLSPAELFPKVAFFSFFFFFLQGWGGPGLGKAKLPNALPLSPRFSGAPGTSPLLAASATTLIRFFLFL